MPYRIRKAQATCCGSSFSLPQQQQLREETTSTGGAAAAAAPGGKLPRLPRCCGLPKLSLDLARIATYAAVHCSMAVA